ncbi:MAG: hypothetical protein JO247_17220 [Chloroflexi bacterium]|nr:hypothetical protein [Chloroflexota bacterium]
MRIAVAAAVALLALAVGILHFALDFVLFRGNVLGQLGPPPGAAPRPSPPPGAPRPPALPFGLQLNQAFLVNLIVFVVLAILVLLAIKAGSRIMAGVDVLIVLATLGTLYGWNGFGRPNPRGLGHWAVGIEIALVILALAHTAICLRAPRTATG